MVASVSIKTFTAFDQTIQMIWDTVVSGTQESAFAHECTDKYYYVFLPGIACVWAFPEENTIKIQPLNSLPIKKGINPWFYSPMIAYILKHRGYHVLHGAAVQMQGGAVILSGRSGAGKSTLSAAMMQKGYPVLTDDVVVIQRTNQGEYFLIPGPSCLKLCNDSMQHLQYDESNGIELARQKHKLGFNFARGIGVQPVPIKAFYEISAGSTTNTTPVIHTLPQFDALKTVMHHVYRKFMLTHLRKTQYFMSACSDLVQRVGVHHIQRTNDFKNLPQIIHAIEQQQGV